MYFLALSQAPPVLDADIAICWQKIPVITIISSVELDKQTHSDIAKKKPASLNRAKNKYKYKKILDMQIIQSLLILISKYYLNTGNKRTSKNTRKGLYSK